VTRLYAQPYDISATGFFFDSADEYNAKAAKAKNSYGWPVEEFEIQFIDGDIIDAALFKALGVHQGNFQAYLDAVESWSEEDKVRVIIAVGEAGYTFDLDTDTPDRFDVDLYEMSSLRDLAEHLVEGGLFGEIRERIQAYLDYDAIARDLGMDYSQTTIDGTSYIYCCN